MAEKNYKLNFELNDGTTKSVQFAVPEAGSVTDEQIASAVESYLEENPVEVPSVEIPTNLPNPHALTFTGAVSATYDGSEAVSVDIPLGGGGVSSGVEFSQIANVVTTEDVNMITVDIPSGVTEVAVFAEGLVTVANKYSFLKANNTTIGNANRVAEGTSWFYDNNIRCMFTHLTHLTENSWSYSFNNQTLSNGQSANCAVGYTVAIKNGLNTLTLCSADAQYKAGFKFFVWGR